MARNNYFGLEENTALELYKLYLDGRQNSFEHHRETLQNYLAFVVAVLGATIAGILQIKDVGWIGAVILVVPILDSLPIKCC